MELIARSIIFLEMLLINLLTTDRCARRNYSLGKTVWILVLYTIFILFVSFSIRSLLKIPYLDASLLILLGLTYFFPLNYLYQESWDKVLSIMLFSWIHTLTVTFFSIQISLLFGLNNQFMSALIMQSAIYLVSTPVVIKSVKNKFLYILRNISAQMNYYLIILGVVEFLILCIIYFYLALISAPWKIITGLLVTLTALVSYHLIYIIVKNTKSISVLKNLVYTDNLTGIKNRLALFLDSDELIAENISFTLIYMDLDNLKKINDTYGHSAGDEYLKKFTEATIATVGSNGTIYRMSGDEFVCLYQANQVNSFLKTFREKIVNFLEMDIPFLGVSIGCARFPRDASTINDLIKKADQVMYRVKKENK